MATETSLKEYFLSQPLIRKFFIGVYPIDKISNTNIINILLKEDGAFFIYNTNPSYKNGEHWRLLMRISENTLFCFDSFGTDSIQDQIPAQYRYNSCF